MPDVGGAQRTDGDFEEQNRIELERMERDALKPEDEGKITATADDANPTQTADGGYEVLDEPVTILEHPLQTFEQAIGGSDYVFTATVVGVSDGAVWNTSDGSYGSHADWEDTGVEPFKWQQIEVTLTEIVLGDLKAKPGDKLLLAYCAAEPSFHSFDTSMIGADLLVGATDWTIHYQDGTTVQAFDIHTQATYVSVTSGLALRLYDANTGTNWYDRGGQSVERPDWTSVTVALSLDELVERAKEPDTPVEHQLGYYDIYGPRETNPDASEVVP